MEAGCQWSCFLIEAGSESTCWVSTVLDNYSVVQHATRSQCVTLECVDSVTTWSKEKCTQRTINDVVYTDFIWVSRIGLQWEILVLIQVHPALPHAPTTTTYTTTTTTTQCKLLYAQVVLEKRPPVQVTEGNHHKCS